MRKTTRGAARYAWVAAATCSMLAPALGATAAEGGGGTALDPAGIATGDPCADEPLFTRPNLPPVRMDCAGSGGACLPLPPDFAGTVAVDGERRPTRPCGYDSVAYYELSDLSLVGLESPFEVVWRLGERAVRERIEDHDALLELLRRTQPLAGWRLAEGAGGDRLVGTHSRELGALELIDAGTGLHREAPVRAAVEPTGLSLDLPPGRFVVVAQVGACADTLHVEVQCVRAVTGAADVIEDIQTKVCFGELAGATGALRVIGVEGEAALIEPLDEPTCVRVTGISAGRTTARLESCAGADGGCVWVDLTVRTLPREAVAPPLARPDLVGVALNGQRAFTTTDNDEIVGDVTDLSVAGDLRGSVRVDDDFRIHYTAPLNWCGEERLAYTVCSPGGCDTASVQIQVICEDIVVFNAISPNGDGANERFTVLGLENYGGNRLAIFDRGGRLVFAADDYDNDWTGRRDGAPLPPGVYFYVLDVEGLPPKSGPLLLGY